MEDRGVIFVEDDHAEAIGIRNGRAARPRSAGRSRRIDWATHICQDAGLPRDLRAQFPYTVLPRDNRVLPSRTSISFQQTLALECAETAEADYLVTGNTKHFPQRHKTTTIVTGRRFLDIPAESGQTR